MSDLTYTNPVYQHSFPDPFLLKFKGEYWAYGTGFWPDGRCFGVLHSPDLVRWSEVGGALEPFSSLPPLEEPPTCYWAPEVTYHNGRFYLYYSVGNEDHMQIRVAVAEHPAGPFLDSGRRLTSEPFAIDAHVFQDPNGERYFFYATDFLKHTHIGTGTVVDRLLDPFTLAGNPHPVTRACYDWHVYDPQRQEKGGVRWHTIEGPFVFQRKGLYYQMFSGGNWQNPTYGVSYATTDSLETLEEWQQVCDGVQVLPILRSIPQQGLVGPGHNSAVRGPDNRQLYCVYHRWVPDASQPVGEDTVEVVRAMAIDPLEWIGERMAVIGPSTASQPVPLSPSRRYFCQAGLDHPGGLGPDWVTLGGEWSIQDGVAVQALPYPGKLSEARLALPAESFLLEVNLRSLNTIRNNPGAYGILLDNEQEELFSLAFLPRTGKDTATGMVSTGSGENSRDQALALPLDFAIHAFHQVRLEVNGLQASLEVDGLSLWSGRLSSPPARTALFTRGMGAAFAAFEIILGWEDLFTGPNGSLADLGWRTPANPQDWQIDRHQLWHINPDAQQAWIARSLPIPDADYELVVNLRLDRVAGEGSACGIYPAMAAGQPSSDPLVKIQPSEEGWSLTFDASGQEQQIPLPAGFDPFIYQQLRFRKQAGQLSIQWEAFPLGEIPVAQQVTHIGIYAHQAIIALDMVRLTIIPS